MFSRAKRKRVRAHSRIRCMSDSKLERMIRWTRNEDESIKRRGTRLSATCRRGWLTNYGYALRKRRARYRNVDGKVSVSFSRVWRRRGSRAQRTDGRPEISANGRGRSTIALALSGRARRRGIVVGFFSRSFSRPHFTADRIIYGRWYTRWNGRELFFLRGRKPASFANERGANVRRVFSRFFFNFDTLFRGTCNNAEDCGLVTACHVVRTRAYRSAWFSFTFSGKRDRLVILVLVFTLNGLGVVKVNLA